MRLDRVTLALLTVQLLFAGHYVAAKYLLTYVPAPAWVALRVGGAAVLLVLFTRDKWHQWPRDARTWGILAGLSLFGVILNQLLFMEGLSRTVPSHSSLINTAIPVATLGVAVLLRQESLTRRKLVALAVSLAGVLVLLRIDRFDPGAGTVQGDLLTLCNATSFSTFLVLSRPVVRRLGAGVTTPIAFLIGAVVVGLYASGDLAALDWSSIPGHVWLIALFIVLGPTVGAYLLNMWALGRVESSRVALFVYLQFVLAAPLSAWLLEEPLSWRLLPAAALVFTGVAISQRKPRPRTLRQV